MNTSQPASPPPSPLAQPDAWDAVAAGYAEGLVPLFERFADDALELAALARNARVVDIACGPGTLALRAARRFEHVSALDFAPEMIALLRERAAGAGLSNIDAVVGDGQSLPFESSSFDGAFSMFGVIFFPDRARGLAEMLRVLAPGGRAVVSSWPPMTEVPMLAAMFEALAELIPGMPRPGSFPLATPEELAVALADAGFENVDVRSRSHGLEFDSVESFWRWSNETSAPLVLMRQRMGDTEWVRISEGVVAHLRERFGSGPVSPSWRALIAVASRG